MSTAVHVVEDVPSVFATLVTRLAPATFALSGGSTAARCYRKLGRRGGDWRQTAFLISDERWVDVDHEDSNEGQARREWLDHVPTGEVHSLRGAGGGIEDAASAYDELLRGLLPLDVVHLGLGDDGHTASLFPGSPALDVEDRYVVATGDDAHPWPRLTFTYPAIAACRDVVITATGPGKRQAFERVRSGDLEMPAARVSAERVHWLVDTAVGGAGT